MMPVGSQLRSRHVECDRPWQFGVRAALLTITLLSVLLAIMRTIDAAWSAVLVWFLLLIVVHVGANAWGTRLRQRYHAKQSDEPVSAFASQAVQSQIIQFAPTTGLRRKAPLGWLMFLCTGLGAVAGGISGTAILTIMYLGTVGYEGIALGAVSAAIIGGLIGFLASTFFRIATRAWNEAADPYDHK